MDGDSHPAEAPRRSREQRRVQGSARSELSPETVQEFQVVNNGLSAESGPRETTSRLTQMGRDARHSRAIY